MFQGEWFRKWKVYSIYHKVELKCQSNILWGTKTTCRCKTQILNNQGELGKQIGFTQTSQSNLRLISEKTTFIPIHICQITFEKVWFWKPNLNNKWGSASSLQEERRWNIQKYITWEWELLISGLKIFNKLKGWDVENNYTKSERLQLEISV